MEINSSNETSSGMGQDIFSDELEVMEINSSDVIVLVSGLDPFTNYTFYVVAVTVAPSEPSDGVTGMTHEAGINTLWKYRCTVQSTSTIIRSKAELSLG